MIPVLISVFLHFRPVTLWAPTVIRRESTRVVPLRILDRHSEDGVANPLTPWTGFTVMCGYAVILVGFAAWRLRRVDA